MSLEQQIQELNNSIRELIEVLQPNINKQANNGQVQKVFTMEEAAEYLGVGYSTLSIKKEEWGIPYFENGTRKLFTKDALDEFLHRKEKEVLEEDEYTRYLKKQLRRAKWGEW